jgi:hypothetical protein
MRVDTMIQAIFNRFERKYLLNEKQKNEMVIFLKDYLVFDPYSINETYYKVFNIYYDTPDHLVIRDSLNKPKYKEKLRIRAYQLNPTNESLVFLEIKKKLNGQVNKRRLNMTYKDAKDYVNNGIKPTYKDPMDQQILKEIDYFIKVHQVEPSIYIEYDRLAMMSQDEHLRITFDKNIAFNQKELVFSDHSNEQLFPKHDMYLMEIKTDTNFPLWLVKKLSTFELFSQSFSKYGKIYQHHIIGGYIDDNLLFKP